MTLPEFTKLLTRHLWLMLLVGVVAAGTVFYLTRDFKEQYQTRALIDTGIIKGYSIENSGEQERVDREFMRSELESLIALATAHQMLEELATRLLARYLLLERPDPAWIASENFAELRELMPDSLRRRIVIQDSADATYRRLLAYRDRRRDSPVFELIYSDNEFFGLEHLRQALRVERKGASDMLEFSYATGDPAVCRQTLSLLIELFLDRQQEFQENQSTSVLTFFEDATDQAAGQLRSAEDKLLSFHEQNNIINYYEQTRFIANKKEDLDELFFKENMQLRAAQATQRRLEEKLQGRVRLSQLNQELLEKRRELARVSEDLAHHELRALERPAPADAQETLQARGGGGDITRLQTRFEELRREIGDYARQQYDARMTPEGVDTDRLLDEWLQIIIDSEQASARLAAIEQRRREFDGIYRQFAPWGSRLKRIEREISLAEDAYLENLHSYNQARLHLQNDFLSARLRVVDAPFYPTEGQSSKRKLLVLVAFLAGIVLTLSLVVAAEWLDHSLRHPVEASRRTGLELAGVFPRLRRAGSTRSGDAPDGGFMQHRAVELLLQHVKLATRHPAPGPRTVIVTSTRTAEGKSLVTRRAVGKLRGYDNRVLHLYPSAAADPATTPHADDHAYAIDPAFFEKNHVAELLGAHSTAGGLEAYDYIFVEMPGLLTGQYPIDLVAGADLSLLVCRADRLWNAADHKALDTYRQAIGGEPRLVLNGVPAEALEESLGELPRRRYWWRRLPAWFTGARSTHLENI